MSILDQYFLLLICILYGISIGFTYHIKKHYIKNKILSKISDTLLFVLYGIYLSIIYNKLSFGHFYFYTLIFIVFGFYFYYTYLLKFSNDGLIIIDYYLIKVLNISKKIKNMVVFLLKPLNKKKK